jgi:hypothetical protein
MSRMASAWTTVDADAIADPLARDPGALHPDQMADGARTDNKYSDPTRDQMPMANLGAAARDWIRSSIPVPMLRVATLTWLG